MLMNTTKGEEIATGPFVLSLHNLKRSTCHGRRSHQCHGHACSPPSQNPRGNESHHHLRPTPQASPLWRNKVWSSITVDINKVRHFPLRPAPLLPLLNTACLGSQTKGIFCINTAMFLLSQKSGTAKTVWHHALRCYIPKGLCGDGKIEVDIKETSVKPTASPSAQALFVCRQNTFPSDQT